MPETDTVLARVQKGELWPVYLLTGEESFLRDQLIQAIRTAAIGSSIAEFNEDKFTAGEADIDKVIAATRMVPLMAPRRFILVRDLDRWESSTGAEDDSKTALKPLDRLAKYAQEPVSSTCLVLTATKLDGRRKLSAVAKSEGFLVSCDTLDARALLKWINKRFSSLGHAVSADAANLLGEYSGPELATVNDAIERLGLYAGPNEAVTEDMVRTCVRRTRTVDTWGLVDAVGARDLTTALRTLADTYDPRDRGLPLLGALAWSIRQLTRFRAATAAGLNQDDAAREAGVFQAFRVRELAAKAKAFRADELERWILVLAETDRALKSSRRPADLILECMLSKLCSPV